MTTKTQSRLSFRLPDFTRYSWVSDKARSVWELRIQSILSSWTEIEWRSVAEGKRSCTLRMVSPEELITLAPQMARHGLSILPLSMQGVSPQPYSNTTIEYRAGEPFTYHAVIGLPRDTAKFHEAYQSGVQDTIGYLLGYPDCCRNFFQRVWVEEQRIDTTWSMATNTEEREQTDLTCKVSGLPGANILLRWLGIRAVPHLPCSFSCMATVEQANHYMDLGRQLGYEAEMDWLEEMLAWPVEWSALHGIAEIKTPVVKIASCTDATAEKCTVQRLGTSYPAEGAQGLVFPYRIPRHRQVTDSNGFKRGLKQPLSKANDLEIKPPWYYTDNGFSSLQTMQQSHRTILDLVASTLNGKPASILDLGCGNGVLLQQICKMHELSIPHGIDLDTASIKHAQELLPEYAQNFIVGDMFDCNELWSEDSRYTLTLLMPGRLLEVGSAQATALLQQISAHSDMLLVYAYGDWLSNYGGLASLAQQVGLTLLSDKTGIQASLAMVHNSIEFDTIW